MMRDRSSDCFIHTYSNSFRQFGLLFVLRPWRSNHSFISNSPTRKARGIMARRKQVGLLLKAGLDWQFDSKVYLLLSVSRTSSITKNSFPYFALPNRARTINPGILIRYINPHLPKYPASSSNLPRFEDCETSHKLSSTTSTFYPRHLPYLTHYPLPIPTHPPTPTTQNPHRNNASFPNHLSIHSGPFSPRALAHAQRVKSSREHDHRTSASYRIPSVFLAPDQDSSSPPKPSRDKPDA